MDAFRIGDALHRLGGHISEWHRGRLLDPNEFDGAAHEADVGGMLAAWHHGPASDVFDWHVPGGDLQLRLGARHFIEAKAKQPITGRAQDRMTWQFRLREELSALLGGRAVSFSLESLANESKLQQRRHREAFLADPGIVARPLADAARRELTDADRCAVTVPWVGQVWVAPTEAELEVRGFQGYALDESYEADQLVRTCVNGALRQLPRDGRGLIVLRYNGVASLSIVLSQVYRRLQRGRRDQCRIDGVLILRSSMSMPLETGIPRQMSWFVPGPHRLDKDSFQLLAPLIAEYPLMPPPGQSVPADTGAAPPL